MELKSVYINVLPKEKEAFLNKCDEVFHLGESVTELRIQMSEEGYIRMIADLCFGLQTHFFPAGDFALFLVRVCDEPIKPHVWKKEIWERFAPYISDKSEIIIQNGNYEIHWSFRNGKLIDETNEPAILAWNASGTIIDPKYGMPTFFYVQDSDTLDEWECFFESEYDFHASDETFPVEFPALFVALDEVYLPVTALERLSTKAKQLLENHLDAKEN